MSERERNSLKHWLKSSPQTLARAITLLQKVKTLTAAGTGHDVGEGAGGLPAICALLACQRTNDSTITPTSAQKLACLDGKQFNRTLKIVERALALAEEREKEARRVTFQSLSKIHDVPPHAVVEMEELVKWLLKNKDSKKEVYAKVEVVCGIFSWICDVMKIQVNQQLICEQNSITEGNWRQMRGNLEKACKKRKGEIAERAQAAAQRATNRSRPNTRQSSSLSPTKNAPASTKPSPTKNSSPIKPLGSDFIIVPSPSLKRKVTISETPDVEESPRKKLRSHQANDEASHKSTSHRITEDLSAMEISEEPDPSSSLEHYLPNDVAMDGVDAGSDEEELDQRQRKQKQDPVSVKPPRQRPIFLDRVFYTMVDQDIEKELGVYEKFRKRASEQYGDPWKRLIVT